MQERTIFPRDRFGETRALRDSLTALTWHGPTELRPGCPREGPSCESEAVRWVSGGTLASHPRLTCAPPVRRQAHSTFASALPAKRRAHRGSQSLRTA